MRQVQTQITILDAAQATGAGNSIMVMDFRHIDLILSAAGMGAGDTIVMKLQGSSQKAAPTFSSAKIIDNEWDYIQMVDKGDGSSIDGDTGITFSAASDLRKLTANVDGLTWITVNITTISDTTSTSGSAKATLYND